MIEVCHYEINTIKMTIDLYDKTSLTSVITRSIASMMTIDLYVKWSLTPVITRSMGSMMTIDLYVRMSLTSVITRSITPTVKDVASTRKKEFICLNAVR